MQSKPELIVHGLNAALAAIKARPQQIIRLFFSEVLAPRLGKVCKQLAAERKIYRQVTTEELEKIARSGHHGGVVVIMALPPERVASPGLLPPIAPEFPIILALDTVANAHNIGAIARTAAFLGVRALVADPATAAAAMTPAAWRVAEGGLEYVAVFQAPVLADWLQTVRSLALIIGTDQHAPQRLAKIVASHAQNPRPVVLVMGNEETGLSPDVRAVCTDLVSIPGSGLVESLNVVQAAAIFMQAFSASVKP
jgi:TrmH RNA methyltransferase